MFKACALVDLAPSTLALGFGDLGAAPSLLALDQN